MRPLRFAFAAAAAAVLLNSCAPVVVTVDTPKEGDTIAVAPEQSVRVRWANIHPEAGSWKLDHPPTGALSATAVKIQPPENGARQLEVFEFVGAKPGTETLTFFYERKDGAPITSDEHITINFKVS
jgi:hypothetical protein